MTEEIKKTVRTRKPTVKATETSETKVETKVEKEVVVEKHKIKDDDRILVMNNTTGMYGYYGATHSFDLESYGQTTTVPFSELRTMATGKHRKHLTEAWLIILDEDVVEELNLGHLYKNIYTSSEIDELLKDTSLIEEAFPKMTKLMKTIFVTHARELVASDQLRDFPVIRTIEELAKVSITE